MKIYEDEMHFHNYNPIQFYFKPNTTIHRNTVNTRNKVNYIGSVYM